MFTADDTGVTEAAQQPIATVIAKACGESCKTRAASIAIGAISTAVAEFEMNSPTRDVTRKRVARTPTGPRDPRAVTIPLAIIVVAPVLASAVASGRVPATRTTVFQLMMR